MDRDGEPRSIRRSLFLIATELFGNGHSSSPSNTAEPFHGPRFPQATIRDNVEADHQLLLSLGPGVLRAMSRLFDRETGQAFQWAVSYPDFMDRVVAAVPVPRSAGLTASFISRPRSPRSRWIPAFKGGDYTSPAQTGNRAFRVGLDRLALLAGVVAEESSGTRSTPKGTTFETFVSSMLPKTSSPAPTRTI